MILAGGFLMAAIEVRYLHREAMAERWQAYVPVVYGFVAAIAATALALSDRLRATASAIFAVGILAGLFGFFLHTEGNPAEIAKLFTVVTVAKADGGEEEGRTGGEKKESEPPALAPLGIAGLAAIGLATSTRRFRD